MLLVPPLGAPDFAYDLRRGCSLVEHLLDAGRDVYLVDYGAISFAERGLGIGYWVEQVVPRAVHRVSGYRDRAPVHLVGWCLGGIFSLLAVADRGESLPVRSITAVASPVDVAAVPLVAPLRPLAAITGGRVVSGLYQAIGGFPAPVVKWAFQLSTVDKYLSKPLTVLSRLDERDVLEQIEAVDHLMNNMHGYPGRTFGQIYHLMLRANDLADGGLTIGARRIELAAVWDRSGWGAASADPGAAPGSHPGSIAGSLRGLSPGVRLHQFDHRRRGSPGRSQPGRAGAPLQHQGRAGGGRAASADRPAGH